MMKFLKRLKTRMSRLVITIFRTKTPPRSNPTQQPSLRNMLLFSAVAMVY